MQELRLSTAVVVFRWRKARRKGFSEAMNLTVTRHWFTPISTCGMLDIDGVFQAYTMEPCLDQSKGKPYAIPLGTYHVVLAWSPKFQCLTPHIEDVPGFTSVEIHWGDYPKDTEACLMVGNSHSEDFIGGGTRSAFVALMVKLTAAESGITIAYVDPMPVTDPELG